MQTVTAQANNTRRQVCTILGWKYAQHSQFMYERGLAYLQWYLPTLEHSRDKLERSQLFWNWWKNCWLLRDQVFASNLTAYPLKVDSTLRIYRETHNSRELLLEGLRPPKYITECLVSKPQLKEVVYEE